MPNCGCYNKDSKHKKGQNKKYLSQPRALWTPVHIF